MDVSSCGRVIGALYLVTFVGGSVALVTQGQGAGAAAGAIAAASYVLVTIALYFMFAPVSRPLSALAALVSLGGIALGAFAPTALPGGTPLPLFGVYCILLGVLVARSAFLPRWLSFALFLAGAGWLSFLAGARSPLQYAPGIVGEGAFMLWLLAKGIDAERWNAQAGEAGAPGA